MNQNQNGFDVDQKEFWVHMKVCFEILHKSIDFIQKNTHRGHILRSYAQIITFNIDTQSKGHLAKAKMILVEDQRNAPRVLDYYKLARICKKENDNLNKKVIDST